MSTTDEKKARARKWVNGYTVAGTAVVIAAIIPGTTSTALAAMEAHMCYAIGKIYKGEDYTMKEAVAVARIVGLVAIAAPMVALEAANAVPIAGWAVKGTIRDHQRPQRRRPHRVFPLCPKRQPPPTARETGCRLWCPRHGLARTGHHRDDAGRGLNPA